jgi:hypothetical protein
MNFLKKHYEKIILALALLVLIGTTVYLAHMGGALSAQVQQAAGPVAPRGSKGVTPVPLAVYENARHSLEMPTLWTLPASNMFPPVNPDTTTPVIVTTHQPDVVLLQVLREPFKLLFQAYAWDDATKEGRNFQINFLTKQRTFFVERTGQQVPDTTETNRYLLAKFEHKIKLVSVPGIAAQQPHDISELTLKRGDEDPIVLVVKQVTEPNPMALLSCRASPEPLRVRRDESFVCVGRNYKVIDITPTQVIILDIKSGEKQTLALTGAPHEPETRPIDRPLKIEGVPGVPRFPPPSGSGFPPPGFGIRPPGETKKNLQQPTN